MSNSNWLKQAQIPILEDALRRRICSVCIDRNVDGTCSLRENQECQLFSYFPRVAQAVASVRSEYIDDYVAAIRENICASCEHQDASGFCKEREEVRCVLDRYLMLIVDCIEEVLGVTLKGKENLMGLTPQAASPSTHLS